MIRPVYRLLGQVAEFESPSLPAPRRLTGSADIMIQQTSALRTSPPSELSRLRASKAAAVLGRLACFPRCNYSCQPSVMSEQPSDSNEFLLDAALRCLDRKQFVPAIKCLRAIASNDPVPDVKFVAAVTLVDTYLKYTANLADARSVLTNLVRYCSQAPDAPTSRARVLGCCTSSDVLPQQLNRCSSAAKRTPPCHPSRV
jgi:hypothetical protein